MVLAAIVSFPEWHQFLLRHIHVYHICLCQELSGPASNGGISQTNTYDAQYERAIQESLLTSTEGLCPSALSETSRFDNDLQLAMELSAKELEERELRLQEEEAELQQVLQLSLTDK